MMMKTVSSLLVVGWLCASSNAWVTLPTSRPALHSRFATRTLPLPDGRNLALYASVETSSPRRRNDNNRDSNNNDRPRRSFGNKSTFGNRNSNNNDRRGGGGGGGDRRPYNNNGSPALTLSNPLKLQRVVDQIPLSEMPDQPSGPRQVASASDRGNNGRSGGGPGGRRPGPGGGGGTDAVTNAPSRETGRRARPPANKRKAPDAGEENRAGPRRTSLRIGTGRKGRGAELSRRRGSLRKRDRSADKEAKAMAAAERKTVFLPEYVLGSGPISVSDLAELIDEKPVAIIKLLMTDLGVMASMTQSLDPSTCIAVVEGFGKIVGGADDMDEEL
eukprot:scaffold710_cov171-Amphora_coffeaeformis.AAC.51